VCFGLVKPQLMYKKVCDRFDVRANTEVRRHGVRIVLAIGMVVEFTDPGMSMSGKSIPTVTGPVNVLKTHRVVALVGPA
jgi:hypothetical protein